jgi:hypothetical protein
MLISFFAVTGSKKIDTFSYMKIALKSFIKIYQIIFLG